MIRYSGNLVIMPSAVLAIFIVVCFTVGLVGLWQMIRYTEERKKEKRAVQKSATEEVANAYGLDPKYVNRVHWLRVLHQLEEDGGHG